MSDRELKEEKNCGCGKTPCETYGKKKKNENTSELERLKSLAGVASLQEEMNSIKVDKHVDLAMDSIWDKEKENPEKVYVKNITINNPYEQGGYMDNDPDDGYRDVRVEHDGPWSIYTDTGFEKAISDMVGFKVDFTEQGMQEDGMASMEGNMEVKEEAVVDEAVGDFAEPIYDLIDELGDSSIVLDNLIRYLDGDTIKDFVEDFRRHHDMNNMEESVIESTEMGTIGDIQMDQFASSDGVKVQITPINSQRHVQLDKEEAKELCNRLQKWISGGVQQGEYFNEEDLEEAIPYMYSLQKKGMSAEEIAKELNMTVDAVKDAMSKTKDEIKEGMGNDMPCTLKCKHCGDMLGQPTTDCEYDSMNHMQDNWVMVDIDGDGDADIAVSNESQEPSTEEVSEAPTMDTTQLVTLLKNAGLSDEKISQKVEEWANTPEGVGEVEPTQHSDEDNNDFAQMVNLSLKRYLDAQDMKVSVTESHTVENMKEKYRSTKK